VTAVASDDRAKVAEVEDPELLRTADEASQVPKWEYARKVKRGAADGGNGNAPLTRFVSVDQGPRMMDSYGIPSLARYRSRHVNRNRSTGDETEQPPSRVVTQ
jgi:hypothetical protein